MTAPSRPGVRRIYAIPCSQLFPNLMLSAICGGAYAMFRADLQQLSFSGTPTFTREGTILNGSRAQKSTLQFRSDFIAPEGVRMAFVVELVNGKVWLIGSREPNYPVVEYSDFSGEPSGEPAVRTYKITHTDIRSGIPVLL
ncbi:MAG: hypothetical protein K2G13_00825 [Muribaculaceae bacterium]|nr:hypothetical protein [Muribaculaceae bacterium]